MKKELRMKVFNKLNNHCAYCGKIIKYDEMEIDHLFPKSQGGTNEVENLLPACRRCNFYKSDLVVEKFRNAIRTINGRLKKIYIFKVALDFGIIEIKPFNGVFYFEKKGDMK